MKRVALMRWAAWAPGIATTAAWTAWARAPRAPAGPGAPEVRFLPSLQRRRCDLLSRMMLEVAQACCPEPLLDQVACVFASRYGPLATTTELLRDLAARSPVSPARFTHSVHNAPAGLFSIWARNSNPSSSLAGGKETFAHGFLEAVAMLHRARGRPVLLVTADETPPQPFTALADRVDSAYALALLLGDGEALEFRLEQARGSSTASAWPDALEFLRWWIVAEATLRITHGPRAWVWTRHD